MAKVPFSKLEAKTHDLVYSLCYCNAKGQEINYETRSYLPIEEKLEMITKIINQSLDDNGYYNPIRVKIFTVLEVVFAYTNLSFTAKQKENIFKLYDQLVSTGIFQEVKSHMFEQDWKEIEETIITVMDNIYKHRNSAMGIIENMVNDYSEMDFNASEIQKKIGDPQNLELLKDVLTKLG